MEITRPMSFHLSNMLSGQRQYGNEDGVKGACQQLRNQFSSSFQEPREPKVHICRLTVRARVILVSLADDQLCLFQLSLCALVDFSTTLRLTVLNLLTSSLWLA